MVGQIATLLAEADINIEGMSNAVVMELSTRLLIWMILKRRGICWLIG